MVMSKRSINLTTLLLAGLYLLSGWSVLRTHTFASKLPFLNQQKEKRKYVAGPGYDAGTSACESDALPTALRGPESVIYFECFVNQSLIKYNLI